MRNNGFFISICIPSYNRPKSLNELLRSIDCDPKLVEIIICEDKSPKRNEIKNVVYDFQKSSVYSIQYYENSTNLGFDGNLRRLVECASGQFVIFMGDDDLFVPNTLDQFIFFIKKHYDKPYILRSYLTKYSDGRMEYFRYLQNSQLLSAGEATVAWLFKRSVSLSGFTISREHALNFATNELDGTLLYQVYLMAQICLYHESMYCDIPFSHAVQSFRKDQPMFGNSVAERTRFTPGSVSHDNSINFTKAYFEVTNYLDKRHGTNLTHRVKIDLSKYSYPFLSIQRKRGINSFLSYARRLENEVGLNCTTYFFIYKWALLLFGERLCDRLIYLIKRILGFTPNL